MKSLADHTSRLAQNGLNSLAQFLEVSSKTSRWALDHLEDIPRVLNFLRGRLEFETSPDDIFIVSYPRSGTTWLQMILYQLTTDGNMNFQHISEVVPWFERSLASGSNTAADFARLERPRLYKSHLTYEWLPKGARYIYVQRDGMDVAVSYFHLYRSHLGFTENFDQFLKLFLAGKLQYCSWFKHIAKWRARANQNNVLLLDFNDLKTNLADCIERIASFCGLVITPEVRSRTLKRSQFSYMKRHESKFDHRTRLLMDRNITPGKFIRSGETGQAKKYFTESQQAYFAKEHSRSKPRLGFEFNLAAFLH